MINQNVVEDLKIRYAKLMIGTDARLKLYKKISTFLKDGVSLDKVIKDLGYQYSKVNKLDPRAIMLRAWYADIENAKKLSEAMGPWVPSAEAMLVQAGETSGRIHEALENASICTEAALRMKSSISKAMIYPTVLFAMLFLIIYQFSTKAVPKLADAKDPSEWPGSSKHLYDISQFVEHQWWVVVIAIVGFALFASWSTNYLIGPIRRVLNRFPPWSIYRSFQSSVFLIAVSAMMRTGIPIFDSMMNLKKSAPRYVAHEIGSITNSLESGQSIGESMSSSFFDVETQHDIAIYSDTSDVDGAIEKIGRASINNAISKIDAISGLLNIVAMALVAGFIGWMYYSFFMLSQSMATP